METIAHWKKQTYYEILGVEQSCDTNAIKKAYHKMALRYHPDRVGNTKEANEAFQYLVRVYETLIHSDRRKHYDETGEDGLEEAADFKTLYEFYRSLYKKITIEDIDAFKEKYIDSGMEDDDISEAYAKYKGNMKKILESVPYANDDDYARIQSKITDMIQEGKVKKFAKFKLYDGPPITRPKSEGKAESSAPAKEGGKAVTRFSKQMDSLAEKLAEKYGAKQKGKKKTTPVGDIPDEEFEAIRKRLEASRESSQSKKQRR